MPAPTFPKPVRERPLADCIRLLLGRADTGENSTPLMTRHTMSEVQAQAAQRLLVVDDNPVNQKVALMMLEKLGYRVDVAGNGMEALAAVCRYQYPLVFMDCQMKAIVKNASKPAWTISSANRSSRAGCRKCYPAGCRRP